MWTSLCLGVRPGCAIFGLHRRKRASCNRLDPKRWFDARWRRAMTLGGAVIACSGVSTPSQAADVAFSLTGHTADAQFYQSAGSDRAYLPLTDAATPSGWLPAMHLADGDVVDVTVSLDAPLTVPARRGAGEDWLDIQMQDFSLSSSTLAITAYYNESITFYDHGIAVAVDPAFRGYGGAGGGSMSFGGGSFTGFDGFAFDTIVVSATFFDFRDSNGADYTSVDYDPTPSSLTYELAAVPEPSIAATTACGLALLGWLARRRGRATSDR